MVLPGLFYYFFSWRGGLSDARVRSLGVQLAQDLMEEIASKNWNEDPNPLPGPIPDADRTPEPALGPEGESRYQAAPLNFDDVDDYHGFVESPPRDSQGNILNGFSGFTRTVEVIYIDANSPDPNNLDVWAGPNVTTNYKRVHVVVSWNAGNDSTDLVNIFSNR